MICQTLLLEKNKKKKKYLKRVVCISNVRLIALGEIRKILDKFSAEIFNKRTKC